MRQAAGRWWGVAVGLALGALVSGAAQAQSLTDRARADLAKNVAAVETGKPTKICYVNKQKTASRQFANLEEARPLLASGRYAIWRCEMEGASREALIAYLRDKGQSFIEPTITATSINATGSAVDVTPGKYTLICDNPGLGISTTNCHSGYTADKQKRKEVSAKVDGYKMTALLIVDASPPYQGAEEFRNTCAYIFGSASEKEVATRRALTGRIKIVLDAGKWTSAADYLSHQDRFKTYVDMLRANWAHQEASCNHIKKRKERVRCQAENTNLDSIRYGMASENRVANGRDTTRQALQLFYDIPVYYPELAGGPEARTLANIIRVGPEPEYHGLDFDGLIAARPRWIENNKRLARNTMNQPASLTPGGKLSCLQFYPSVWPMVVAYAQTGEVKGP